MGKWAGERLAAPPRASCALVGSLDPPLGLAIAMLAYVGSLSGADCGTARLKLARLAAHPRRGHANALRWLERVRCSVLAQPELLDVVFHVLAPWLLTGTTLITITQPWASSLLAPHIQGRMSSGPRPWIRTTHGGFTGRVAPSADGGMV